MHNFTLYLFIYHNAQIAESSILMDTIRCFGANPTPISYSELFTSLQTGVVDGAEDAALEASLYNKEDLCADWIRNC
nr:hypothetical protein [uncultured Clostridium sp.]